MRRWMRWGTRSLGLMVLTALLIFSARAGNTAAATQPALAGEFVGRVDGSDAFVAVVADGERLFAFVCDGTDDGAGVWEWFRGTLDGDHAQLTNAAGQTLVVELAGDAVLGSVTFADGVAYPFVTEAAIGDAGLYRLDETLGDRAVVGGWIVLNDGDLRGQAGLIDPGSDHLIDPNPDFNAPGGSGAGAPRFTGTGGFNARTGTASISDGTSNAVLMPAKITSGIIAILIG